MRIGLIALLMAGCGSSGGSEGGVKVDNVDLSACNDGDSGAESTLTVDPAGPGAIRVEHETSLACCIDGVRVEPHPSGTTLTLDYEDKGTPCDCICNYTVSYDVSGLSSGDWTVVAQQDEATVTVE